MVHSIGMKKHRSTSIYSRLQEMLERPAHCIARNFAELDSLQRDIEAFKKSRKKGGLTTEESLKAKTTIVKLLRELDRLAPKVPRKTPSPAQLPLVSIEGKLGMLVAAFEDSQRSASGSGKTSESVERIKDLLTAQRIAIQPKRPARLTPTDHYSYREVQKIDLEIDLNLYSKFARAFATSVTKDRDSKEGRQELLRMPHTNQIANEILVFVAMLDFARKLDDILKQCHGQDDLPTDYWSKHQTEIQAQLKAAQAAFNEAIASTHLVVKAGDPGFSTNHHYLAFIEAEQHILNAEKFGYAVNAVEQLKEHAFEFILGGTDKGKKGREQTHHKLLSRIEKAYQDDQPIIVQEKQQHQTRHADLVDQYVKNGAGIYNSPFTSHSLHTLNRVYEARYALLADEMFKIVKRYTTTLANANITSADAANDPGQASPRAAALAIRKRDARSIVASGRDPVDSGSKTRGR